MNESFEYDEESIAGSAQRKVEESKKIEGYKDWWGYIPDVVGISHIEHVPETHQDLVSEFMDLGIKADRQALLMSDSAPDGEKYALVLRANRWSLAENAKAKLSLRQFRGSLVQGWKIVEINSRIGGDYSPNVDVILLKNGVGVSEGTSISRKRWIRRITRGQPLTIPVPNWGSAEAFKIACVAKVLKAQGRQVY